MTPLKNNATYEIDRLDESQAIVIRHIEDESNGQPLFWGLVSYVALMPVLFGALMLMSFI
ncbi:MAG: hypothetical protein ACX94C_06500 [Phycisphaerales bacterium]